MATLEEARRIFEQKQEGQRRQESTQEKQRFSPTGLPLESGEVFPLSAVDKQVEGRGSLGFSDVVDKFKDKGFSSKAIATLEAVGAPFRLAEAGVANVGLSAQRGEFNPLELASEFGQGLSGQKLGELGDIIRSTGALPEGLSKTIGFTAALVTPVSLMNKGIKAFSKISKFTDKGIKQAGEQLIKGSDAALDVLGKNLSSSYAPVNNVSVNIGNLADDIAKLPKMVLDDLAETVGQNMDDFLKDFTIQKARALKGAIGQWKAGAFGKDIKGANVLLSDKKVNRIYSTVKNTIKETLEGAGLKKEADSILKADDAFTEAKRAANFLRKKVTDPVLLKPTKGGSVAAALDKGGDVSTREALNVIRGAGKQAQREIDKAIANLNSYNRIKAASDLSKRVTQAIFLGGAAGAVVGRVARGIGDE